MLDLNKVAGQVSDMAAQLKDSRQDRQERIAAATGRLKTVDYAGLNNKIENSRTTWLAAGLTENPSQTYDHGPVPDNYYVLAADGSQIDIDRHHSARCFLINIGNVQLKYGDAPEAEFSSDPRLYSGDEQMVIASAEDTHQEQTIESNLLGIKRAVEECAALAAAAAKLPQSSSTLALLDGSLILWGLAGREYPEFVIKTLLDEEMLGYLDKMRKLDINNNFGLASYISYPRGNDVLNTLRIEACPHPIADTDKYCASCESRECDVLSGIQDRDLFDGLLVSGQRSALFKSRSKIIQRYGPHKVYFFYLKLEEEIARVELPEWSAITSREVKSYSHFTHRTVQERSGVSCSVKRSPRTGRRNRGGPGELLAAR